MHFFHCTNHLILNVSGKKVKLIHAQLGSVVHLMVGAIQLIGSFAFLGLQTWVDSLQARSFCFVTIKLYFKQQFKTNRIVLFFLAFLRDGCAGEGQYVKSV